jgi:type II secretory pathway component GspD/PulD (secretin)
MRHHRAAPYSARQLCTALVGLLLASIACAAQTQTNPAAANQTADAPTAKAQPTAASDDAAKDSKQPTRSERRRAVKLFLEASKLFEKEQFEEAMAAYKQAAALDPTNNDYTLAVDVANSHAVTALIQAAAKARIRGDAAGERAALAGALELDPRNIEVTEHLHELAEDAIRGEAKPRYEEGASRIGEAVELVPAAGVHSFHLHTSARQVIPQVFKAWGLECTLDESVRAANIRLDMDDASFEQAMKVLNLLSNTFYVPLDPHRVVVASDTPDNRKRFTRQVMETVYLPGMNTADMDEVAALAKNVFEIQSANLEHNAGTITVRGSETTVNAFNATLRDLLDGHSQVMLEVRIIQLAHTSTRNTGITPPQTVSAYNVYAEEQSILNANQALVQQIISSGLASPNDPLAILLILAASGQVSNSLFSSGLAIFGGGKTLSALSPGGIKASIDLNSSDSRELDQLQLRLGDGEAGTVRSGTKYPIQTSSFSSLSASVPNIPGLTGAGSSSALSSLLAGLSSSVPNIPQVQYQDLGMTLKTTPKVLRNNDVALTIDLKIDALAGSSINGNPILDSRVYTGVVTLPEGQGAVIASELDAQESRAISGTPGLSEIPGLNNLTDKNVQKNGSTLLIVITPHVIRGTQAAGHTPMLRIDKSTTAH